MPLIKTYETVPWIVEAAVWGPTWGRMKEVARWIGESGVYFRFDAKVQLKDSETEGLPRLFIYDERFDMTEVRIKDVLVKFGPRDIRVFSREKFDAQFTQVPDLQ